MAVSSPKHRSLNLVWPVFKEKIERAILNYQVQTFRNKAGWMPVDVFESWRSVERMKELWDKGRVTPGPIVTFSKPGYSWHYYGLAVDIVFRDSVTKEWSWKGDFSQVAPHFTKEGIEWLGAPGSKFHDPVHFQLTGGIKIETAFEMTKTKGLQALWLEVEKRLSSSPIVT